MQKQKKLRSKGKNSDNMLLNEFIIENNNIFKELHCKWNYMPFLPNAKIISQPNFFHFVGIIGKNLINNLQANNKNIMSTGKSSVELKSNPSTSVETKT